MEKLLPTLQLLISAAASVPYWYQGNWRMGCYWLCAAGLTFVVTW